MVLSYLDCTADLRLVHFVLVVHLDCEVHVLHDDDHQNHPVSLDSRPCADDGKFVLQLGLQLPSIFPFLLVSTGFLRFVTGCGLGLIIVSLFVVVIAFTFLVLCMMPCNMFAFTSSTTRPPLRKTENCFDRLLELVQSYCYCSFDWTACRRCLL